MHLYAHILFLRFLFTSVFLLSHLKCLPEKTILFRNFIDFLWCFHRFLLPKSFIQWKVFQKNKKKNFKKINFHWSTIFIQTHFSSLSFQMHAIHERIHKLPPPRIRSPPKCSRRRALNQRRNRVRHYPLGPAEDPGGHRNGIQGTFEKIRRGWRRLWHSHREPRTLRFGRTGKQLRLRGVRRGAEQTRRRHAKY